MDRNIPYDNTIKNLKQNLGGVAYIGKRSLLKGWMILKNAAAMHSYRKKSESIDREMQQLNYFIENDINPITPTAQNLMYNL